MKSTLVFRITIIAGFIVISFKDIFVTRVTHTSIFYDVAINFFNDDVDKVYEAAHLTDIQRVIEQGLYLLIGILIFFLLGKVRNRLFWPWFFLGSLSISPIISYLISSLSQSINPFFFLHNAVQDVMKTDILSLFQHLVLRNTISIFCTILLSGALFQVDVALSKFKKYSDFLGQVGGIYVLSIISFWFTFLLLPIIYYGELGVFSLATALDQIVGFSLLFSLFTLLIFAENKRPKTEGKVDLFFRYFVLSVGLTISFFYWKIIQSLPFGDLFFMYFEDDQFWSVLLYCTLSPIIIPFSIKPIFENHLRQKLSLNTYKSELSNLKSQINPHFLFNSLNSLYGLALEESSPKTSTGIQKLSEMMRFMLRENVEDKIEISREFEYVENYIELQKLRVDGNEKVRLEYEIDKACEGKITPMLIIPFIENAFKHGVSAHHNSWIEIKLSCSKEAIHLNVKNSNHNKSKSTEEESGIGLENVRQRLALLYPDKHLFQLFENEESFEANLKIELN